MKPVFLSPLLCRFLSIAAVFSCAQLWGQSVWTGRTDSQWGTADNWSAGIPNSNTAWARFADGPSNRNITVNGIFTFQTLEFHGAKAASPYILTGGTFHYDRNGGSGGGIVDVSIRDNTVNSAIEVRNSGSVGSASVVIKNAISGTLTLGGTITTATNTVFDVRKGGNLVITGNLVGDADTDRGFFNQTFQVLLNSSVTIEGPGVSSNPGGGTVALSLGSDSSGGTMNLNRAAALAGGMILVSNPATVSLSVLNLGADNAIANDDGVFRTQVSQDGQSVNLNTNGFSLDLGNKRLRLFPFGSAAATFAIDLGIGKSAIRFAASNSEKWRGTLAVSHFSKGSNSIRFGTDSSGLKPEQLALITINGAGGVSIDSQGFLVAPQP